MIGTGASVVLHVFLCLVITKHSVSNIIMIKVWKPVLVLEGKKKAGYTEDDHREQGQHVLKCY